LKNFCLLFKSNTLDRDKKKKKKFGLFGKSGDRKDAQSGDDSDNELENLEPVPSYELVTQHEGKYLKIKRKRLVHFCFELLK
jgi:hypothetical protein